MPQYFVAVMGIGTASPCAQSTLRLRGSLPVPLNTVWPVYAKDTLLNTRNNNKTRVETSSILSSRRAAKRASSPLSLLLLLASMSVGCGTTNVYLDTTAGFSEASVQAAKAYREQVNTVHTIEARAHIERLRVDPGLDVNGDILLNQRTFSKKALAWHLKLGDVLSNFGQLLARIAKKDLGGAFSTSVNSLSESVDKLASTTGDVPQLSGVNEPLQKMSTGLSGIVGTIGAAVIEAKQEKAIRTAILASSEPLNELLGIIETNQGTMNLAEVINADQLLSDAIGAYQGAKSDPKRHSTAWKNLKDTFDTRENLAGSQAELKAMLQALRKAHRALVKVANNADNASSDIGELLHASAVLGKRAKAVLETIEKLKKQDEKGS